MNLLTEIMTRKAELKTVTAEADRLLTEYRAARDSASKLDLAHDKAQEKKENLEHIVGDLGRRWALDMSEDAVTPPMPGTER